MSFVQFRKTSTEGKTTTLCATRLTIMFLLLAIHLLCVNLAGTGPLLLLWLEWKSHHGDTLATRLAQRLSIWSIAALFAGALTGLIVGMAYWSDSYQQALADVLMPKVKWAIAELGFSAVLMVAVALWWSKRPNVKRSWRWLRSGLNLLAGTNLIYHFPLLLLVLAQFRLGQLDSSEMVTSAQFRVLITQPAVLSRAVHFIVASFAVTGIAFVVMAKLDLRRQLDASDAERTASWGARIALSSTLMQIPIGIWLVSHMPAPSQSQLMGKDPLALVALIAGILLTLGLLQSLAAISFGEKDKRHWSRAIWLMMFTVASMCYLATRV